jgi:glucose-6-phosphate 1-dehydrogenase
VVFALGQISAGHRDRDPGGAEAASAEAFCRRSAPNSRSNYLRFRLSPNSAIALAARVKLAGEEFIGEERELYLSEEQPGEETPYERLLGDAMGRRRALHARRRG